MFVRFVSLPLTVLSDDFQAEVDLRKAQADFDRQAEITKLLLEGVRWVEQPFSDY